MNLEESCLVGITEYGVKEWAVVAIQSMCTIAKCRVDMTRQYSEDFDVKLGVH